MSLFGVFSGPEFFYEYPNGDQVHNVSVVYLTRDVRGAPRVDGEEGLAVRYFDPDALPDAISPPVRPILGRYAAFAAEPMPLHHRLDKGEWAET